MAQRKAADVEGAGEIFTSESSTNVHPKHKKYLQQSAKISRYPRTYEGFLLAIKSAVVSRNHALDSPHTNAGSTAKQFVGWDVESATSGSSEEDHAEGFDDLEEAEDVDASEDENDKDKDKDKDNVDVHNHNDSDNDNANDNDNDIVTKNKTFNNYWDEPKIVQNDIIVDPTSTNTNTITPPTDSRLFTGVITLIQSQFETSGCSRGLAAGFVFGELPMRDPFEQKMRSRSNASAHSNKGEAVSDSDPHLNPHSIPPVSLLSPNCELGHSPKRLSKDNLEKLSNLCLEREMVEPGVDLAFSDSTNPTPHTTPSRKTTGAPLDHLLASSLRGVNIPLGAASSGEGEGEEGGE